MFTVGFYRRAMVITTNRIDSIIKENVEEMRRLVIQVFRNPSGKLIIDFNGISRIDEEAFNILDRLYNLAEKKGVIVEFANLNSQLLKEFKQKSKDIDYRITKYIQLKSSDVEKESVA